MQGISWLAEDLLASVEGLCSMELRGVQKRVVNSVYRQQLVPWGHFFIQHYNSDAYLETEFVSVQHLPSMRLGISLG